jgi:hypothetical protein
MLILRFGLDLPIRRPVRSMPVATLALPWNEEFSEISTGAGAQRLRAAPIRCAMPALHTLASGYSDAARNSCAGADSGMQILRGKLCTFIPS